MEHSETCQYAIHDVISHARVLKSNTTADLAGVGVSGRWRGSSGCWRVSGLTTHTSTSSSSTSSNISSSISSTSSSISSISSTSSSISSSGGVGEASWWLLLLSHSWWLLLLSHSWWLLLVSHSWWLLLVSHGGQCRVSWRRSQFLFILRQTESVRTQNRLEESVKDKRCSLCIYTSSPASRSTHLPFSLSQTI